MKKISTVSRKQNRNFPEQKLTIGFDLGDRSSWYCVLDEQGEVVLEQRLGTTRSEEHTSELQSPCNIVFRLLLEKKSAKRLLVDARVAQGGARSLRTTGGWVASIGGRQIPTIRRARSTTSWRSVPVFFIIAKPSQPPSLSPTALPSSY